MHKDIEQSFDYDVLDPQTRAFVLQKTMETHGLLKRTAEHIVQIGQNLLSIKASLGHGYFEAWLQAEFAMSKRQARRFILVAERFGGKSAIIADLPIQPTAAYLLAAPAVPDEAREVAIEKAKAGEQITVAAAKEIVAEAKKKGRRRAKPIPADKLALRLVRGLERYKERWNPKELADLAQQLREFADALEKPERGGKKKTRA